MREGHTIVRDAAFSIQVAADRETAAFILTASGKPTVTLTVLDFEVPVISGMSCVIKTIPVAGAGATIYTVKPFEPATAEKLAKCLDSLQVVVRKRLGLPLAPTPQPPLTPQVKVAPPRSLICAHSPESSTEQSPRLRSRELVELSPRTPVQLDEVIGNIRVLVRNAYCQATGCSVPMLPAASPGEQQQQADAKLSAWLKKGKLDSDADETKLVLEKILCFLGDLQFSMAAAREPLMSSKTMEEMRTISPSAKSQRYSAPEILELNKVAVVPAGLESAAEIIEVKEEAAMLAGMDNASDAMKPEETAVVTLAAKPKMGLRSSLWAHK
ncbi:hypothetical protein ISF_07406 [Cordyceps fumosorosea ARSEF 2679]|uniref:Uncharacterized protein n=1 Tax=Cordyceps fumosorosea (strain ARSEF 2679) TaxID=1081104 RepID=A0A167PPK3_CORFA|nr:hypothetical protein ISF_07406 [Cordyceps fumosorosea ARSEF 2679]OAA56890.1 hypothetical protein ISF_07406 [Cordyceps fumosorosea ARSEF 2679]